MLKAALFVLLALAALKPAVVVYRCVAGDTTPRQWGACIQKELL